MMEGSLVPGGVLLSVWGKSVDLQPFFFGMFAEVRTLVKVARDRDEAGSLRPVPKVKNKPDSWGSKVDGFFRLAFTLHFNL